MLPVEEEDKTISMKCTVRPPTTTWVAVAAEAVRWRVSDGQSKPTTYNHHFAFVSELQGWTIRCLILLLTVEDPDSIYLVFGTTLGICISHHDQQQQRQQLRDARAVPSHGERYTCVEVGVRV